METKIIKAVFGGGTSTVTNKRTRTDYGQVLEIIGIDLPDTFECIFSNSATSAGVGKKMIGSAQRVLIPDEYLTTGQTIYAWILLHDTEDDGRHMYSIRIPVADMPDTSPEEPTPVEQSVISQAITALNSAVTTTTQKALEASESADRAEHAAEGVEGYAERAESAQQAAEDARDIALEAKVSAQASAATASEKASEAISSATTASQSALTAEDASESAQEYATASAESASQASQSAESASESASASAGNANFAASKALDASNSASEAAQSASTAVQAKTDAETAKTASETAQGLAETARNDAVSAKTGAESARDEAQSIADGITGKVEQIDSNTDRIESLEDDRYKPYAVDTASGAVASFSDGADDIPLKSCIVRVDPVQDLHGYDHPWPAGGGKNLLDPSLLVDQIVWNQITISLKPNTEYIMSTNMTSTKTDELPCYFIRDGISPGSSTLVYDVHPVTITTNETGKVKIQQRMVSGTDSFQNYNFQIEEGSTATSYAPYENICPISGWTEAQTNQSGVNVWDEEWEIGAIVNGVPVSSSKSIQSKNFTSCVPGNTYFVISPRSIILWWYDYKQVYIGQYTSIGQQQAVAPANARYFKIGFPTAYGTTYNNNISINYPSTDHDYHPYVGQTYPITFPSEAGTVYGGYVDVLTGELVIDRAQIASYNGEVLPSTWISDRDVYASGTTPTIGAQVVYKLAEPIHYPLTPTEIKTLLGTNNIWSNTGDTEVTYRADTTLYISKKIAEALASLT